MLTTGAFLILSMGFALLLWRDGATGGIGQGGRAVRVLLILALPWLAFLSASSEDRSERLRVSIDEMRVPLSVMAAQSDAVDQPFLIAGDRSDQADLVVPPYPDRNLSRLSMPDDARNPVQLMVRKVLGASDCPGQPEGVAVHIRLQSFAADGDAAIPGLGVALGDRRIEPGQIETPCLAPGRTAALTLYRIDAGGHWEARRRFDLGWSSGRDAGVVLRPETPLDADAGSCRRPVLRMARGASENAIDPDYRDPDNLLFNGLGAGGIHPLIDSSALGPVAAAATLCTQTESHFLWPRDARPADARLKLSARLTFLPWYCCLFVTLCVLALHLMCVRGWRAAVDERILVPFLQWLMTLRLLIAVAGCYNDVQLRAWSVLWDAMAALVCVPVLAVIVLRPGTARAVRPLMIALALLVMSGVVGTAIALKSYRLGDAGAIAIPLGLCVLTLGAALGRCFLPGARAPLGWVPVLVKRGWAWMQAPGRAVSVPVKLGGWWRDLPPLFRAGLMIVVAIAVMRLGLVLLGRGVGIKFTERAFGFPLSAVHVPGMAIGFALMLHSVPLMERWRVWAWICAAFVLAYFVVPLLTHDLGLLFVSGWPLGAVIGWYGWRLKPVRGWVGRAAWLVPAAIPPALVGGFALLLLASGPIPSPLGGAGAAEVQADGDAAAYPHLGPYIVAANRWDRNDVRILGFIAPDEVARVGTRYAFEVIDLAANLGPITRDLTGHGYLAPSNVRKPTLDNQYFENLAAIHLIWPLGRIGIIGFLCVVAAAMMMLTPAPAVDGEDRMLRDWTMPMSVILRLSFAWAAGYLILADLNWLPFTGRNIYLLSVTSGGDLVEGMVLLLLACLPFHLTTGEEGAWR